MKKKEDLSQLSMLELFRIEVESQAAILSEGLLALERGETTQLEKLMRAAHSLKGAARIVNFPIASRVAHAMEDCFVAAQRGAISFQQSHIDVLFRGVDLLQKIARRTEDNIETWEADHPGELDEFLKALASFTPPRKTKPSFQDFSAQPPDPAKVAVEASAELSPPPAVKEPQGSSVKEETPERVLRLTADNLNRLLGLAGESLVESRWLRPFAESLQRLKRQHAGLAHQLDQLRESLEGEKLSERTEAQLHDARTRVLECQQFLGDRIEELDLFDRRSAHLSHRLYLEVLRTRMRPFGDGVRRFPRMIRDLAHMLGKAVKLEIVGEETQVDRDILERLETPLAHLLRNAVDHGCEPPEERQRTGKPPEATIRLEARHSAGMLLVTVTDDGAGVQTERVRTAIANRNLTIPGAAEKLSEPELLEYLFVPGFTLKETVTEISGRGIGLDVVQNMVKSVRGAIRVNSQPGRGLRVQLQLPLTLSVLRALLVEIAGEPYAIPLNQIANVLNTSSALIQTLEGRPHVRFGEQQIGLLSAHQVLECEGPKPPGMDLPVVVLGERNSRYGLVVDRFLGERELVVQPLDSRLGKVRDISAAALMEDGSPVLIVDVDEVIKSIERLISLGKLAPVADGVAGALSRQKKRVLVVDDSLSVRELERKFLAARGYLADTALDGVDAWNAVHNQNYDLVVTDVDMPGLDGIELASLIKKDPLLKTVAVLIVSYKDSEEDRLRGLEAGADAYLTKGSFDEEALLQAVVNLIGES